MAMSLDYLGNWVLIVIAIMAAVGLIVAFQGDVKNALPGITPSEDKSGAELIEVEGSAEQEAEKIAEMVRLCNDRALEKGYEGFTCFLLRNKDGEFEGIGSSDIRRELGRELENRTEYKNPPYTGETIIIRYDLDEDSIVVEQ
ncbi:MAG: hypothetical protein SVV03_05425 [Candidatus Nanohaloarchaea archaeon]|nr:hypothetical protein [Candidatus Nanohaloarchaea archaeon]